MKSNSAGFGRREVLKQVENGLLFVLWHDLPLVQRGIDPETPSGERPGGEKLERALDRLALVAAHLLRK